MIEDVNWPIGWMLAGWIAVLLLLIIFTPRDTPKEGALRLLPPEVRAYRLTIIFIILHIVAGIIIGSWRYSRWFELRDVRDPFWGWWPMALVYIVCIIFQFLVIDKLFRPKYTNYKRKV